MRQAQSGRVFLERADGSDFGQGIAIIDRQRFAAEYPFADHFLDIDGLRYHYVDEGAGEPLLMVHGNPTWSFYYRKLVQAFASKYRTIAVDHIGCGLSDKPADYPYRLANHIDNLKRLVDQLKLEKVTLIAHDWGGAIGLGAFADQPDRLARIVLFNTAAFRSQDIPFRIAVCRWPILGQIAVQGFNGFAGAAIQMATEKPERMTPAVRAGYLAPYDSWNNRIATHRFVLDIPLTTSHPSYNTLAHVEKSLIQHAHKPITLIWGMRDWCFTPKFLERFREFFPQADVVRYDDAGHYVVEDAHERIIPYLNEWFGK